jgi:hypothetical protein
MTIEIGTRVLHPDEWTRKEFPHGVVVEIGAGHKEGRARVRWIGVGRLYADGTVAAPRNLRTWVSFYRLEVA